MSLLSIFQSVQDTDFFTAIRESALTYPIILTTHLACIAVFGGMIVITNLRLLGVAMRDRPVADVIQQLRPWKAIGFVIMVTCGILLGGSKAVEYYGNPYFWTKMTLLALIGVHALVFRGSVYKQAAQLDTLPVLPARVKAAACLSLVLWTGVLCFGRLIGYYEPPNKQRSAQIR